MWIERLYELVLLKAAKEFPCLYISGARQIGKTSLIQKAFPTYDYVSLDDPALARLAETAPHQFFAQYSTHLIIDEIQYAPSLFRQLKVFIDKNRKKSRYILTGSQNFLMLKGIQESLAGRCGIITMGPLFFSELAAQKLATPKDPAKLIIKGGYPELWKNKKDQNLWFQSYIITYLERDIRNILNINSLRDFERFLRALAFRTGCLLSYTDLAKDVGIAISTAKEWVSVLKASHQIDIIEPYFKNVGKRLIKTPKIYFTDSGLASYLNGIMRTDLLSNSNLLGQLWETYVFNQIRALNTTSGQHKPIWFWRTSDGSEVDFVFDFGGRYQIIEVKYAEKIDAKDLKGILAFSNYYGSENVLQAFVVCNTKYPYRVGNVNVINLSGLPALFSRKKS